jgi:hypothetical protein
MVRLSREQLQTAYDRWPAAEHDKTTIRALLLRLRIEEVVRGLPRAVIAGQAGHSNVARRLRLTIGTTTPGDERDSSTAAGLRPAKAANVDGVDCPLRRLRLEHR